MSLILTGIALFIIGTALLLNPQTTVIALAALTANAVLGAAILYATDRQDGRLLLWARANPCGSAGFFIILTIWPVVVTLYLYGRSR